MSSGKFLALITGGAQGFGRAFAEKLLANGGRVALLDLDKAKGSDLVDELSEKYGKDSSVFYHCDVTDVDQLKECFANSKSALGGLNIVCNNAGRANAFNRTLGDFSTVSSLVNLNLTAVINGTHLGVQHMSCENGGSGGVVINVASMAGLVPLAFAPEYAATKHGVVGFTRSLAGVFKNDKIRVNCICPGFVATRLVLDAMETDAMFKNAIDQIGLLPIEQVVDAFYELVENKEKDGACSLITQADGIKNVKLSVKFLDEPSKL